MRSTHYYRGLTWRQKKSSIRNWPCRSAKVGSRRQDSWWRSVWRVGWWRWYTKGRETDRFRCTVCRTCAESKRTARRKIRASNTCIDSSGWNKSRLL